VEELVWKALTDHHPSTPSPASTPDRTSSWTHSGLSCPGEGVTPMAVEYLVLQAEAESGPFARVTAPKRHQSWETLQAALDELGQD
jgi:hypothetical protein